MQKGSISISGFGAFFAARKWNLSEGRRVMSMRPLFSKSESEVPLFRSKDGTGAAANARAVLCAILAVLQYFLRAHCVLK